MEIDGKADKDYVKDILFNYFKGNKQLVDQYVNQVTKQKESKEGEESFEDRFRKEIPTFFTNGQFKRRLEELYLEHVTQSDSIVAELDLNSLISNVPLCIQIGNILKE